MKAYSIKKIINKNLTVFPVKLLITVKKPLLTDFKDQAFPLHYIFDP